MNISNKSFFGKAKIRFFIPATVLLLFVSTFLLYSFHQQRIGKNDIILSYVMQLAERDHVSPTKIDDKFSEKVFDAYLKKLDPSKSYLTKEDVTQMEVYRLQIDDQIKGNTYQLYDLAVKLMDSRILEVQGYYREILSQPFDFTVDETYETDPDKYDWPANSAELKESWRKDLKYLVLFQVVSGLKAQENETDLSKIKTLETIESEARQRILKSRNDIFQDLTQKKPEAKFSQYMNAITSIFDPHTEYRTAKEKEDFDMAMSGQMEGIGATLGSSDGYVRVASLVPGSPSWRQGELKVNDHITKVKQENEDAAVDIYGKSVEDAVKLIRGKKGTRVTLTVKRGDGTIHEITITRDVIIMEETYAKSAIFTDPATRTKVGYIDLPGFYIDFKRSATGRSSADDVAVELEKLKKDGVQGIILDLRQNGGGSLQDVNEMGRLFVPEGPIVQVKSNYGPARIFRNPFVQNTSPSEKYDGPFVILVSTGSASASEILSAAMQDYKRAVIMGAPHTYGKGTVQVVHELDDFLPPNMSSFKPLGALNLTFQNYYRISGESVQLNGVESDIVLPDLYSEMKFGERYQDNCLPWTTVAPARYNVWKNPVPLEMLKKKSLERTSKSEGFKLMNEQVANVKKRIENTQLSLNLETYRQEENKRREENKRFDEISKLSTSLTIAALSVDIAEMKGDTAKIARSEKWITDLNKDIFIEEAVKVIGDMR